MFLALFNLFKAALIVLIISFNLDPGISSVSLTTADETIENSLTNNDLQTDVSAENDQAEQIEKLRIWVIVSLVIAFAVLMAFALIIQSHRELKKQYSTIHEQQKQLEIQNDNLKTLNQEKNSVISYVSHDLLTPLVNIEGLAQLIALDKDKLTDDQINYLGKMGEVVNNGKLMIHSMLNVNKIEQELKSVEKEEINLVELLDEVRLGHKILSDEKEININLATDPETIILNSDRLYLKQIFANLISNAIKFSDPKSNINLKIIESEETLSVHVIDEGPGMSDRDKERLFLKYQQLSSRPTGNETSTGLGLAIVKELVDKLNGKIRVVSELEKGTTFMVEFLK